MFNSSARIYPNLAGFGSIMLWSFYALLANKLTSIPPFQLLFLQFSLAFLVTVVRYLFSKDKEKFLDFSIQDLMVAAVALSVNEVCYFASFHYAPAQIADLINDLWPTFVILLSFFLPRETFRLSYVIACMIAVWGVYHLVPEGGFNEFSTDSLFGLFLAFISGLSWALYCLYTNTRKKNSSNCLSLSTAVSALFTLFLHLRFEQFVMPSMVEWSFIFILGTFLMGLAYHLWEYSAKEGSVKLLALLSYMIPIFSILVLALFNQIYLDNNIIKATLAVTVAPVIPLIANKFSISRFKGVFRRLYHRYS